MSKIPLLLLLLLLYLKNIISVIQVILMHRRLGSAEQETSRSRRTEVPVMRMKMIMYRLDEKKKDVGKEKGGDEEGLKSPQGEKRVCGEGQ